MKLALALALATAALLAQPIEVKWSESPVEFAGKRVVVHLTNGARFDGTWVAVTPNTVRFRRSNKPIETYAKSTIAQVRVGHWRIRGRVLGTVTAFYAMSAIALRTSPKAGHAILPAMAGGYALGRAIDKNTLPVVFLPG